MISVRKILDREESNKLEEVVRLCRGAIKQQLDKNAKGGFGLDDYTDGRIVGGASLARNILRLLGRG